MTAPADSYVSRQEQEAEVLRHVEEVRESRRSRALLVHGPGGAGKTMLVRHLADRAGAAGGDVVWVKPIDVDDSEFWLLSNLESEVADQLGREWFDRYFDRLRDVGRTVNQQVSYETVLARLSRINRTFVNCYREFVEERDVTVVITLDTIEAIRSMYLLLTLTQWMKELPRTLFILSGRPAPPGEPDPLREELSDRHRSLQPVEMKLSGFADDEARRFLDASGLAESLSPVERDRLIDLTDRQPLWLALAVEYLRVNDVPPEMTAADGSSDGEAFRRRLVTLYRDTDFWPEAIKRLAVVRHSVTEGVWVQLMSDRSLPSDANSWPDAWRQLLARPWVRPRANARYVTLHDALAEELAQRLIPLHDRDGAWRRGLWHHARQIYSTLTEERGREVDAALARIGEALPTAGGEELIAAVSRVDAEKRELDQLLTAQLHYAVLDDFAAGTERFLELCDRATNRRDPLFMELISHEMEQFLPRDEPGEPPEEVLDLAKADYRRWLLARAPARYVAVAVRIAGFLIRSEQPRSALELLENLPDAPVDPELRYRLAIERGNACIRIPGHVQEARAHILDALEHARRLGDLDQRVLREAEAYKELGFYNRNLGYWRDADAAYRTARDVLARVMGPGSSPRFREEMASIQTNWAYLKALRGSFREARNLIDTAVAVRRRLTSRHNVGASLSVSGEVYRYEANFGRAWSTYQEAETIFQETKSWPWLGTLYQEMAICLHQATRDGSTLIENQVAVTVSYAERALDLCHESNARAYPSALNRAGRIFFAVGRREEGLENLRQGILEAERIGDGWFRSANNIEYVEYAYRAWTVSHDQRYRDLIDEHAPRVTAVIGEYGFKDIAARWELLQGHLLANDGLVTTENGGIDEDLLDSAAERYSLGFRMLADESVGSHGSAAIAREFTRFRALFDRLPLAMQGRWYKKFAQDWTAGAPNEQSISLLARLEELY